MIVAVAAEGLEFAGWLRHCSGVKKLKWPVEFAREAEWNGARVTMVANGAGPRLASEALTVAREQIDSIQAVMSIGLCGALDPALRVNDIFTAVGVRTDAGDRAALLPRKMPEAARGVLLSVDRFAQTAAEKAELRARGASAVEMEAAGLRFAGPFYVIRVVSDTATEDFHLDFNACRSEEGRFLKGRIALAGLRYPKDLMRMAARGKAASSALGDFLANCEL